MKVTSPVISWEILSNKCIQSEKNLLNYLGFQVLVINMLVTITL